MITTTDPRLTTKALIVRHPIRRRSAAPMIGPVKRGLFGRVLAATGVGNVRDVRRGRTRVAFGSALRSRASQGSCPSPTSHILPLSGSFSRIILALRMIVYWGPQNFPQS
jgi:hypothetical protein